jgi:hypothetical protein
MAHEANPSPVPAPRANPALARDCTDCLGWGTLITREGVHQLCPNCQTSSQNGAPLSGRGGVSRPCDDGG